ncbi:MAG: hypothetical protein WCJ81_06785 [bacterium]
MKKKFKIMIFISIGLLFAGCFTPPDGYKKTLETDQVTLYESTKDSVVLIELERINYDDVVGYGIHTLKDGELSLYVAKDRFSTPDEIVTLSSRKSYVFLSNSLGEWISSSLGGIIGICIVIILLLIERLSRYGC